MPHQSTSFSSYESLQNTQHIAIEEPYASSSNSMPKVEPIVADRQHVLLTDSELPENTTTGFKQTSSRTKPVVRHHGADAYDLSPFPPNFLILPLRAPVQPAHTAVGVVAIDPMASLILLSLLMRLQILLVFLLLNLLFIHNSPSLLHMSVPISLKLLSNSLPLFPNAPPPISFRLFLNQPSSLGVFCGKLATWRT